MHVWLVKRIHALSVMSVGGVRGCHRFMYCALIAPVPQGPGVVLSVACTVDKDRVSALSLHSLPVLLFATL